jgi:uncharacterized protein
MKGRYADKRVDRRRSERMGITDVATLDRRHFGVVRPSHIEALTIVTGQ